MLGKLIVCLVGVLLFVFGAYKSEKRRKFLQNGEETIAEVYDYQKNMNDTWCYVYAYTPLGRKRIIGMEAVYNQDKQRKRKPIGTKVPIVYNPEKPEEFMTKQQTGIEIGFYIMMIMGILYVLLGLFVI